MRRGKRNEEDFKQAHARGARLDTWLAAVQVRCANETRAEDPLATAPLPVLSAAEQLAAQRNASLSEAAAKTQARRDELASKASAPAPAAEGVGEAATVAAPDDGKWVGRLIFLVIAAVLSVLVAASSRLLVAFPWMAVVVGLLWALHFQFGKRKDAP